MFKLISIALLALSFSNCAMFKGGVPSASVIQVDVTFAVSVARDAALVNPSAELAVNAFVGTVHSYLAAVQAGTSVLPNVAQAKADIDGIIAQLSATLPASLQPAFVKVAGDLEAVILSKYSAFYGYVGNVTPYVAALVQATS